MIGTISTSLLEKWPQSSPDRFNEKRGRLASCEKMQGNAEVPYRPSDTMSPKCAGRG